VTVAEVSYCDKHLPDFKIMLSIKRLAPQALPKTPATNSGLRVAK
jgi:hypothetical protein